MLLTIYILNLYTVELILTDISIGEYATRLIRALGREDHEDSLRN